MHCTDLFIDNLYLALPLQRDTNLQINTIFSEAQNQEAK